MESLVADVESGNDAFAKVFLAHSLADVQEKPEDELAWDLRALAFMDELTDQRALERGNPGGENALLPSLHLNLPWITDASVMMPTLVGTLNWGRRT